MVSRDRARCPFCPFRASTMETFTGWWVISKESSASGEGWLPYKIEVEGADHEGIIHEVASYLSERGINIESMETGVVHAPVSATLLFTMSAIVAVPPALAGEKWEAALQEKGDVLNVDIRVSGLTAK